MAGYNQLHSVGFGPVTANPTVFSTSTLTTVVQKPTLATCGLGQVLKVKISNLTATTNRLAWVIQAAGLATPTITATPGTGVCGTVLGPLQSEYIVLKPGTELFVIGSAVSTILCVSSYAVS